MRISPEGQGSLVSSLPAVPYMSDRLSRKSNQFARMVTLQCQLSITAYHVIGVCSHRAAQQRDLCDSCQQKLEFAAPGSL